MTSSSTQNHKRHQARFLLIQALYQWQLAEHDPLEIVLQFKENPQFRHVDQAYFTELLHAVTGSVTQVDALYTPYLDRPGHEVDPIELSILRLATYELAHRLDIPYRVIINEALELAKLFGAVDSHKYVNGILDKVAKQLRAQEQTFS